jgi:hypothetical protein
MSKLPRWDCSKPRDAQDMIKWVKIELDRTRKPPGGWAEGLRMFDPEHVKFRAIEQAEKGNMEPLRRLLPGLARFLHRPKQKRGKRFPKDKEGDPVTAAASDVKTIRKLWKTHYGKMNRPKNDPITAEQIAADRHGVDVEEVVSRLKKIRLK